MPIAHLRRTIFLGGLTLPSLVASTETVGCFHYYYGYADVTANTTVNTITDCQSVCQQTAGCLSFTYYIDGSLQCYLSSTASQLTPIANAVAGPPVCSPSASSACTEVPGAGFPGADNASSHAAWPSGIQPTNAQCWPRGANGYPMLCSPQNITILEDRTSGWSGRCLGLHQETNLNGTCANQCYGNPLCSVWAWIDEQNQCWQGSFGDECYLPTGPTPSQAQRVQHGTIRTLKSLQGVQVLGLTNMFNQYAFENTSDSVTHCRYYCAANLGCQYWQYSNTSGCWVEDPSRAKVAYPLTTKDCNADSEAAKSMIAGEYIQHLCSEFAPGSTAAGIGSPATSQNSAYTFTSPGPSSSGSGDWYVWLLSALSVLLCVSAVGGGLYWYRTRKGASAKRGAPLDRYGQSYANDYNRSAVPGPMPMDQVPLNPSFATMAGPQGMSFPNGQAFSSWQPGYQMQGMQMAAPYAPMYSAY